VSVVYTLVSVLVYISVCFVNTLLVCVWFLFPLKRRGSIPHICIFFFLSRRFWSFFICPFYFLFSIARLFQAIFFLFNPFSLFGKRQPELYTLDPTQQIEFSKHWCLGTFLLLLKIIIFYLFIHSFIREQGGGEREGEREKDWRGHERNW
jgi:hypothetical protein